MPAGSARVEATEALRAAGRVHIVGAGPVGLFLAALLQSVDGQTVRLYERRDEYTRTRMVSLAPSTSSPTRSRATRRTPSTGRDVEAIFDPTELETRLAYRRAVAADLRALLQDVDAGVRRR